MKKLLPALLIAGIFASCARDKSTEQRDSSMIQDTTSLYSNNASTDISQSNEKYGATIGAAVASSPEKTYKAQPPVVNKTSTSTSHSTKASSANNGSGDVASTPAPAKKKGWSHRAKGAAVGAGTGAITGALINKENRGVGALIGGLVGAASGYVIGNEVDKKKKRP